MGKMVTTKVGIISPYGHEDKLCHAESYIVYSKIVDRDLYVVSSGGIIRIYDIDKLRMKTLIELPYKFEPDKRVGAVSKCHINSDGSHKVWIIGATFLSLIESNEFV